MTPPTHPPSGQIPKTFVARLRRLRARIAAWFLVDGLSRLLLCAVVWIGCDLLIDWLFQMDRPQRIVMAFLAGGMLTIVCYRRLVRPLACRVTDDALCLEIERTNPLGESLISALQLARIDDFPSRGMSAELAAATIDQGMHRAADLPFGKILRSGRFFASGALLILTLAILAGVGVLCTATDAMAIWFDRNVLLGDRSWPPDVHFVVEGLGDDGRLIVPRGDDWTLVVTVDDRSRRFPTTVHLDVRDSSGRSSHLFEKTGPRRFESTWRNVAEPFEFRVRSHRASTPWLAVELVDRPAVETLDLQATLPKYAGARTERLPPGKGPYYLLKGSTLSVRGTANKRLSKATLVTGAARHTLSIEEGGRFHATLPADRVTAGVHGIELADTERLVQPGATTPGPLVSRDPTRFTIQVRPDRKPRLSARLVGIGTLVVPKARVPFQGRISDDYGLTAARLSYAWQGEEEKAPVAGEAPLDAAAGLLSRREVPFQSALDISPLNIPIGSQLSLSIEAHDNDDISGPKLGRSTTFVLRVVGEDQFRIDLLRREKECRLELEKILKQQDDISTECEALRAAVRGKPALEAEKRQLLIGLERRQELLGTNLAALADRLEGLLAEVQNNRIEEENGPLKRRLLHRVIAPMRTVAVDAIPRAAGYLDQARRQASDSAGRDRALTDTAAAQQAIGSTLREILTHLVKVEGFQEAVNLLYEIQQAQKDVLDRTDTQRQERIRAILDQGGNVPGREKEK